MCTSTAVKPARSKAAAISTWPLTPCSRRTATPGRAAWKKGAEILRWGQHGDGEAGARGVVEEGELLFRAGWVVAEGLDVEAGFGPHFLQGRTRFNVKVIVVVAERDDIALDGSADAMNC